MADTDPRIVTLRSGIERYVALVEPLTAEQVRQQAFTSEWTIADVASHLGSQSEIFRLYLDAGASRGDGPGREQFPVIWDVWNARTPDEQATESVRANREFLARLDEVEGRPFSVEVFGRDLDLPGFAAFRIGELGMHTWDIAVALNPSAELPADVVAQLVDVVPELAGRSGKPETEGTDIAVTTTDPERHLVVHTGDPVSIETVPESAPDAVQLTAENYVRLVYGRLPARPGDDPRLDRLRAVFQGF